MLAFAIVAMFVAGLMVGRTPEYLGKKLESREVKMTILALLSLPLSILGWTALATVLPAGLAGLNNTGPHGFSEILYAYTSGTGNNGSAFAGLSANTLFYNTTIAGAMLMGRFLFVIPLMAVAGSLAEKKLLPPSAGTFPTHSPLFVGLLVGVVLIIGGLTYFPALSLGPVVEQVAMNAGTLYSAPCAKRLTSEACNHDHTLSDLGTPAEAAPVQAAGRTVVAGELVADRSGDLGLVPEARPQGDGEEPGDVLRRDRLGADHHLLPARSLPWRQQRHRRACAVLGADHALAVVHRCVRQFRRGGGRGAGADPRRQSAA